MTFLIAIVVGVICLGLGFIGGKLYTEKNFNKAELQQQFEDSQKQLDKLKEDVSANLVVTQKLMNDMKSNYDSMVEQMNHATKLLEEPRQVAQSMPFFSPDATDHLAVLGDNEKKRKKPKGLSSQPSDYSDGSSGLFNNTKPQDAGESQNA